MIIAISGKPGSGKSTAAKLLASELKYKHYSTGDLMRNMAEEKKISLLELSKIAEEDMSIDEELDQRQIQLGREEDNFVIDGRLSWHFIPKSIKIFITASEKTRASRILSDRIRNENNIDMDITLEKMKKREESEDKRYKEYYGLDVSNESNYDLIIDSSYITPEEVVKQITDFLKKNHNL